LPNIGPYIYTTLAFLALLGAPYIYEISSLRVKGSNPQSQYVHFKWLYTGGCGLGSTLGNSWQAGYANL